MHFYRAVLLSYRLTVTYFIHKNAINICHYMHDWKSTFYFLATNAMCGQKLVCGQTQKYCKFYFKEAYDLKNLRKSEANNPQKFYKPILVETFLQKCNFFCTLNHGFKKRNKCYFCYVVNLALNTGTAMIWSVTVKGVVSLGPQIFWDLFSFCNLKNRKLKKWKIQPVPFCFLPNGPPFLRYKIHI